MQRQEHKQWNGVKYAQFDPVMGSDWLHITCYQSELLHDDLVHYLAVELDCIFDGMLFIGKYITQSLN